VPNPPNITNITPPRVAIIDERTGAVSREWYRFFYNLFYATGGTTSGAVPVDRGGTGSTTRPANGQLLIGNSVGGVYNVADLGTGPGISKTVGNGSLSIENTGVLSNIAGSGIAVDHPTGDVTISNTGVLSFSADSTGLTPATATTGAVTLGGVLNETHGGTNQSAYATGDLLYASAANTLSKFNKPSATAIMTMNGAGVPAWKIPKYGSFHDTGTQTAAANTPTAVIYGSTDYSNGVTIGSPTSHVVVDTAGLYNIQFSLQLNNNNATIDNTIVWLKVNGNNIANTASWAAIPGKHAASDGYLILSLNIFYQFAANDYFELIWMTVNGTTSIITLPASTVAPVYPASPGVILTVSDNIAA